MSNQCNVAKDIFEALDIKEHKIADANDANDTIFY